MYNLTYEELLQRALDRVTATVDKTEGSFIYDAIAPTIVELHQCYYFIRNIKIFNQEFFSGFLCSIALKIFLICGITNIHVYQSSIHFIF